MIHPERIKLLNGKAARSGAYVLYWMQQSQRATANPALELAISEANKLRLPLVVCFGLMADYPEANARHYTFMLQGLHDVGDELLRRGIAFVIKLGRPDNVALSLSADAALTVCDRGYLRHQKLWREKVAANADCAVIQVEGDVVVPIELASSKAEYGARTIRPKVLRYREDFLTECLDREIDTSSLGIGLESDIDLGDVEAVVDRLSVDRSIAPVRRFVGGTREAKARLESFLADGLEGYADGRNEPSAWQCSFMSPYLHFGNISPVDLALAVKDASGGGRDDKASYLEELIVRRELAANFVHFQPNYDRFEALPSWAKQTLQEHRSDKRDHVYTSAELERAETHDPFWNAAMREMVHTGFMHNYMRMYWGKKILEWSPDPETAFATTLRLNNRYFLDGRDPSSFTNVAWCFGLHDRAWAERSIFGKIRFMNAAGLQRKFDMERYLTEVDKLVAAEAQ